MPKEVILIAAVTVDGFIARHSREVITWSKDLQLFKKQTTGFPVIMGSNTYDTLYDQLEKRDMIIVNRYNNPESILSEIAADRCFIIGGGKTYSRFAPFLTHLYITPHPYIFGVGVRLFSDPVNALSLRFETMISVDETVGIYQYQYKVQK
jgi:dihydrofolate reductase|tara:strand:- start:2609 stop:3061 length:453 start_codon:yes stop_codon:yes gene_type:complete